MRVRFPAETFFFGFLIFFWCLILHSAKMRYPKLPILHLFGVSRFSCMFFGFFRTIMAMFVKLWVWFFFRFGVCWFFWPDLRSAIMRFHKVLILPLWTFQVKLYVFCGVFGPLWPCLLFFFFTFGGFLNFFLRQNSSFCDDALSQNSGLASLLTFYLRFLLAFLSDN